MVCWGVDVVDIVGLMAETATEAPVAAPGANMGNPPEKDRGNVWAAAAAAAACTVAERDSRDVESGGTQGVTPPPEGALREEESL